MNGRQGRSGQSSLLLPGAVPKRVCRCLQPRGARLAGFELRALAFDAVAPAADRSESGVAQLDAQQRAALAEQLGYRSIGAELPEDVSLGDVIQSLPKSVSPLPTEMPWLIFHVVLWVSRKARALCRCCIAFARAFMGLAEALAAVQLSLIASAAGCTCLTLVWRLWPVQTLRCVSLKKACVSFCAQAVRVLTKAAVPLRRCLS